MRFTCVFWVCIPTNCPLVPAPNEYSAHVFPSAGKVVDRHWYDRNKHIFPANRWEVYDADA